MRRPRRRKRRALTRRADSIWRTRTGSPRLTRPKFAVPGGTQIIRKNGFHTFHLIIRFNRSVYACVGFFAATIESALLFWLTMDKHGAADRAIHEHSSGWLIRIGEILSGPLALVLRFFGLVPLAAISFLIGALISRFGWIAVGKISGSDPESVFAAER